MVLLAIIVPWTDQFGAQKCPKMVHMVADMPRHKANLQVRPYWCTFLTDKLMRRLHLLNRKQHPTRMERKCTEATQRSAVDVIFALNQSIPKTRFRTNSPPSVALRCKRPLAHGLLRPISNV